METINLLCLLGLNANNELCTDCKKKRRKEIGRRMRRKKARKDGVEKNQKPVKRWSSTKETVASDRIRNNRMGPMFRNGISSK